MTELYVRDPDGPPNECQSCWRPWVWRVTFKPPPTRLGPKLQTKHRYACTRHFIEACWLLQPDQARHRELAVASYAEVMHSGGPGDPPPHDPVGRTVSPQESRPRSVPMGVRMPSAARPRRTSHTPRDLGARRR